MNMRPAAPIDAGRSRDGPGNACCNAVANCAVCVQCEPAWAARPMSTCCCCVAPLIKGAPLAASGSAALSLFCIIYFAALIGSHESSDSALGGLLYFEYCLHFFMAGAVHICSITTTVALLRSSPGAYAVTCRCLLLPRVNLVLVLSRLLRTVFYISLFTMGTLFFAGYIPHRLLLSV